MVASKQHHYDPEDLDLVHRYLLERASKRNRKLILVQKDIATELGIERTKINRMVAAMVDEGRLRVLGEHARSATVIVNDLP